MGVVREALLHINNFFPLLGCKTPGVLCVRDGSLSSAGFVAAWSSHLLTRGNVLFCEFGGEKNHLINNYSLLSKTNVYLCAYLQEFFRFVSDFFFLLQILSSYTYIHLTLAGIECKLNKLHTN